MRAQQLLGYLKNLPLNKTDEFAHNINFSGGWEAWLQAEIGYAVYSADTSSLIRREVRYPDGAGAYLRYGTPPGAAAGAAPVATAGAAPANAARCDFYLQRPAGIGGGAADETYIELKCINPTVGNPINDGWNRFEDDVVKLGALKGINGTLVGYAILATFGNFTPPDLAAAAPLSQYWSGTRSAYVLDTISNNVTPLKDVATGGVFRLFIVAVSV
jgi:hypothetical protein